MTAALILASGLSERMGRPKALLPWSPTVNFLEKIVFECLSSGCTPVVCTVGREILPEFRKLSALSDVEMVVNPHPERERIHAIRLGLARIKQSSGCLVLNVDNPFIESATIRKILAAADPEAWCSPEFRGTGGHPVLLPAWIMARILGTTDKTVTLRTLLGQFPKKVVEMEDDQVLRNINTPDDYRAAIGH